MEKHFEWVFIFLVLKEPYTVQVPGRVFYVRDILVHHEVVARLLFESLQLNESGLVKVDKHEFLFQTQNRQKLQFQLY